MTRRCEVLVIGAGPAGLTAAVDLARREIAVRVLGNEFDEPLADLVLQPRTLEILDDLGVLPRILPRAVIAPSRRKPIPGRPFPDPIVVAATAFTEALESRLRELGTEIERHRGLLDVRVDDEGRATFATANGGREQVHAAYLLATDPRARDGNDPHQLRAGRLLFADIDNVDLAIQDAYNLTWKLAAVLTGAEDSLLDTYERERLAARDRREGSEVHYRDSSMSQELGGQRLKVRAGDRVPDLRLWSPEHGDVRLFDLLRGTHWTILGIGSITAEPVNTLRLRFGDSIRGEVIGGGTSANVARGVTVTDRYGECRRLICRKGGSLLAIRPDGHLGLRTNSLAPIVGAYLEDIVGEWNEASL